MNIPDKAYEAAGEAVAKLIPGLADNPDLSTLIVQAIKASAPHIASPAWEEGKRVGWIESETRALGAHNNPYQED